MGACFFGLKHPEKTSNTSYGHLLDSWDMDDMERCDKLAREHDHSIDIVFEDFLFDKDIRSEPIPIR